MANIKKTWEKKRKYSWSKRMKHLRKVKGRQGVDDNNTRGDENINYNNNVSDDDQCLSKSDEAYDCSALDLTIPLITVWDGIMQTDEPPSIPTVGAVKIPEEEIRDCGSPDSAVKIPEEEIRDCGSPDSVMTLLDDLLDLESSNDVWDGIVQTDETPSIPTVGAVKIPEEEICDYGSPDSVEIVFEDLVESGNEDEEEDDPSVIYIADDPPFHESYVSKINKKPYDPPFRESYASKINKKLVLSEEFNIFDNISQGSNDCDSSGQSVRSRVNPEFVCIMNPKIKYICASGIDTVFQKPENLPCGRIMHPIGWPYKPLAITGITEPCLVSIERYYVKYR